MDAELKTRLDFAKTLAKDAGALALSHFNNIGDLVIQSKGVQDMVSNADLEVETFVRDRIIATFPDDGIVGEEHGNKDSQSGHTWVIDPIDGTANFVASIPAWCVILACVQDDQTKIAAIYEPCHDELFWGALGEGAYLNDASMKVSGTKGLHDGSVGVGMNGRTATNHAVDVIRLLCDEGGIFYRNASGGLMLSYVASGRLIGYIESHMNAWDCLAGQLLIAEAGGTIEQQSANDMLKDGGRVVACAPIIFDKLKKMADIVFKPGA